MSTRSEKIDCGLPDAIFIFANFARMSFSTATPVNNNNPALAIICALLCRPLSSPLAKSEHDSKEKSCHSSEKSFRN